MIWSDIPGWMDYDLLYDKAVDLYDNGIFVEVGTYLGRSLCYLGQRVKMRGKAGKIKVVGVDWCVGSGVEHYQNGDKKDNHSCIVSNSGGTFASQLHRNVMGCNVEDVVTLMVGESTRVASLFPDQSLTFVFLDAKHDYDHFKADLLAWLPKVRPGGMIAGDDVGVPDEKVHVWPDIQRVLDECLPGWRWEKHDAWSYEVKT